MVTSLKSLNSFNTNSHKWDQNYFRIMTCTWFVVQWWIHSELTKQQIFIVHTDEPMDADVAVLRAVHRGRLADWDQSFTCWFTLIISHSAKHNNCTRVEVPELLGWECSQAGFVNPNDKYTHKALQDLWAGVDFNGLNHSKPLNPIEDQGVHR